MSSPRTYSRCCTNSTECPKNGLLCMPVMNPSTTSLARRSSRAVRATTSGARKRRGFSRSLVLGTAFSIQAVSPAGESSSRRSQRPARRSPAGETKILGREDLLEPLVLGQFALAAGRLLDELVDDHVRGDAFGGGGEVRQDAVPQHRQGQCLHVFRLH